MIIQKMNSICILGYEDNKITEKWKTVIALEAENDCDEIKIKEIIKENSK